MELNKYYSMFEFKDRTIKMYNTIDKIPTFGRAIVLFMLMVSNHIKVFKDVWKLIFSDK